MESKSTDNGRFIQVCVLVGRFTLCFFPPRRPSVGGHCRRGKEMDKAEETFGGRCCFFFYLEFPRMLRV